MLVNIKSEQAVSRVLSECVTIYLGCMLPHSSSDYKELDGPPLNALNSILLRVGFTGRTSRHAVGELLPRLSTLTAEYAAVYLCCTILGVASTGR